jgi:hypothetical protein
MSSIVGVAFSLVRESRVDIIREWPGREGTEPKVPTALAYRGGDSRVQSWGVACPASETLIGNPGMVLLDRFKLCLDEKFLGSRPAPWTHENVRQWFKDYLRELYTHVKKTVTCRLGLADWNSLTTYFVLSGPTLWDGGPVAQDFERIARAAGFGREGKDHSVEFDLNEAEAAAMCTATISKDQYLAYLCNEVGPAVVDWTEAPSLRPGDGTTDISTLQVESMRTFNSHGREEEIAEMSTLDFINVIQSNRFNAN